MLVDSDTHRDLNGVIFSRIRETLIDKKTHRQDHVGHIAFFSDNLKPRDSFSVADDLSNFGGSVLFDLQRNKKREI
jgi:hypothetical protein